MSVRAGYLHDYLVASFIGLGYGLAGQFILAGSALIGDWGPHIGMLLVIGLFTFIPGGLVAGYINFRFHDMGENLEMAGLSAGFFTAFVYTIVDLFISLAAAISATAVAANIFIAWAISALFAFIFFSIGGYLSGMFERRPFMMPTMFNLSRVSRAPPPPPPTAATQACPTCRKPLTFVQQYNRWYCTNCKKYS